MFSAATGVSVGGAGLLKAAERVYNVERAFLVREGVRRQHDYPPEREFTDPLPEGPWPRMPGSKIDKGAYDRLLDAYYSAHGWDASGVPLRATLEDLDLGDVAEALALPSSRVPSQPASPA
jgi:aldehyde:ferredoxin oxidoreductase